MNLYLLFKSLHLIAVISWMAGLLYLPRIFVYHSEAEHESQKKIFKTMERKLYNYKINGLDNRVISVDHYRGSGGKYSEETPVNTIEFIYKHVNSKNNQLILDKSLLNLISPT